MLQAQGGAACKSEGVWCAINARMDVMKQKQEVSECVADCWSTPTPSLTHSAFYFSS